MSVEKRGPDKEKGGREVETHDGRNSSSVGSRLDGRVEELRDHSDRSVLKINGRRVLLSVDEVGVLVLKEGMQTDDALRSSALCRCFVVVSPAERKTHLIHELLNLGLHEGSDEGSQVEGGSTVAPGRGRARERRRGGHQLPRSRAGNFEHVASASRRRSRTCTNPSNSSSSLI